jgi:hypothetical protein
VSLRWIDALGRVARRRTHRLRLYFGTQRVNVDLLAGWHARRSVQSVSLPVGDGGTEATFTALVEALRALRAGGGSLRGLTCDVVLADRWIVYDVVPIDLLRVTPAAAGTAVSAALADVSGARADALEVRWQWQSDGRSVFAMALPRPLLARLRGTLASGGIELGSATGEFVAVYNTQRASFTGRRVVFAVGREAGAQIAVLMDGIIRATRFELGGGDGASLSNAASGVLRERGDDTTTPTRYVLDADSEASVDDATLDARWSRVRPPAWVAAAAAAR